MHRSTERIITTHVGSLARPTELLEIMRDKETGKPYDHDAFDREVRDAVADRVHRQVQCGLDVVADGEMGKVSFLTYVKDRLGGFVEDDGDMILPASWRKEIADFPGFYNEYLKKYSGAVAKLKQLVCTGPVTYVGQDQLETDIDNLNAALAAAPALEAFMPSSGPSGFGRNEHYASHGEYLAAVGEAMRVEYLGIVDAGFVLQIDDPWLMEILSDPTTDVDTKQRGAHEHVDVLNQSLRDIPRESIRHHICYGLNHGPRMTDIPLAAAIPWMMKIDAGAYSFEVANPRHQHEWKAWEDVDLPDDTCLIPGLLGHATNYVEHPELIADWIGLYAGIVGRERVIAGADCGFSSRATFTPEVHPDVVWAKFEALVEGARIATTRLWA
jgi:5-methyltetrahydropteroyltriglutamate--homocysteine methyltransferase